MLERPLRARSSVTSSLRSQRTTTELMWPLIKRGMKGKLPPFNDWHNTVVDDEQGFLYLYGGCPPKTDTPCSDFYRCEMETMMWEDLTVRFLPLRFLPLIFLFQRTKLSTRSLQVIPSLHMSTNLSLHAKNRLLCLFNSTYVTTCSYMEDMIPIQTL